MKRHLLAGLALLLSQCSFAQDYSSLVKTFSKNQISSMLFSQDDLKGEIRVTPTNETFILDFIYTDNTTTTHHRDFGANGLSPGDFVSATNTYSDGLTVVLTLSYDHDYSIDFLAYSTGGQTNELSVSSDTLPWFARQKNFDETSKKAIVIMELYRNQILNTLTENHYSDMSNLRFDDSLEKTSLSKILNYSKPQIDAYLEGKKLRSLLAFRNLVNYYDDKVDLVNYSKSPARGVNSDKL